MLISLQAHETMLLRAATVTLNAAGVSPISFKEVTDHSRRIEADPLECEAVETVLMHAARFSSGIWSMHYTNLAESIRAFKQPQLEAGVISVPLDYEPDHSKTVTAITGDRANVARWSLTEKTQLWRDGLLKRRFWRSATNQLLNSVYLPLFGSLKTQADLMTKGAVSVYARALRENIDVISAFGVMKDIRGRPDKSFMELADAASLIYGMHLFNASLERLYSEVFKGSTSHAAAALMGDEIGVPELNEWAFGHRWKGFYASTFHGELALRMVGSAEETFLRMEREGDVGGCMQVLQYLRDHVALSETDYIAHQAKYGLIADFSRRTAAISSDEATVMTLVEWRAEADELREGLEGEISPFPKDYWQQTRSSGGSVAHISSASGWRGPSDQDDDDPNSVA